MEQIYSWHAKAVERAAGELALKGVDKNSALAQAKKTPWVLVDNHSFRVGDRWVAGEFIPANGAAKVSLYVQAPVPGEAFVPKDAPIWTVRVSYRDPNIWVYGTLPEGKWFPATNNELAHAMGLPGEY